ncbi:hypothetical protein HPB47_003735 [Ixodes persulcatus]|uniref:Uncharacterized protein n=1 Tax=Ixodes persulcatus TaxID=34615 RepID=A0AC60PHM9_IXOPE|nr:hypothetical protein HPB47_003735 [Ixodes persulcatus]
MRKVVLPATLSHCGSNKSRVTCCCRPATVLSDLLSDNPVTLRGWRGQHGEHSAILIVYLRSCAARTWQFDDGAIECPVADLSARICAQLLQRRGARYMALISSVDSRSTFSLSAAASRGDLTGFQRPLHTSGKFSGFGGVKRERGHAPDFASRRQTGRLPFSIFGPYRRAVRNIELSLVAAPGARVFHGAESAERRAPSYVRTSDVLPPPGSRKRFRCRCYSIKKETSAALDQRSASNRPADLRCHNRPELVALNEASAAARALVQRVLQSRQSKLAARACTAYAVISASLMLAIGDAADASISSARLLHPRCCPPASRCFRSRTCAPAAAFAPARRSVKVINSDADRLGLTGVRPSSSMAEAGSPTQPPPAAVTPAALRKHEADLISSSQKAFTNEDSKALAGTRHRATTQGAKPPNAKPVRRRITHTTSTPEVEGEASMDVNETSCEMRAESEPREDYEDTGEPWQEAYYRRRKKKGNMMETTALALANATKPTSQEDRYVIVFRAQERYDITSIPVRTLQRNFYTALNVDPARCRKEDLPTFRSSKVTNTVSAIVPDRSQAQVLLKMKHIQAPDKVVEVVAHEIPPEDTCRGVAHGVDPNESPAETLDDPRCRYREILYARALGNRGLALVTFQGKRPPRTVLYHDFITKVTLYRPTTVVCRRCQGLGQIEKVCTKKPRCPDCGCITQEGHVCERTYCVNCHVLKHLATDPKCPARIRADQMRQQKSKRGKPSNKRRCTATAASTKEKPPQVTIEDFPLLNRDSSSHRKAPDTGRSRSRSTTSAGLHTGRKASRSASRNGHRRNRSRGRSTSARRANSRDYAQAVRKPQGYYADDEHEVRAWQEELRAIDTEKQADNDRYKRLEAELMQLKRKMEESDRRRDARRNTILGHIKAAMEARRAGREQQRQQKEQHVGNPTPEIKESAPSTQMLPNAMGNKPLRILQWNCRGLSQRRAELNHRLKDQTFDILLLQETKTDQITIPGYKQYYMPSIKHTYKKEEKIQAQAAIFIQEKMHHIIIDTSRWCTELQEVVAIRVALQSTERRLTIASAYLRPQKKRDYSWIMHLRKDYPDDFMVLGGDLNVHVESWGQPNKNPHAKALYEIMEQADVTMANDPTKPTRYPTIANQRESIIDITLTPANTARILHWTVLDDAWGSDHFPIIIELNIGAKSKHPKKQT